MEKINVTNVRNFFSGREDVKEHDLYAHGYENLECCNCAKMVTRKRSQGVHTLLKHSTNIQGV